MKSTPGDFAEIKAAPIMQYVAVLALGLATFSRPLESELGLPRAVNWVHFPIVCAAFALSLRRVEKHALPLFLGSIGLLFVFGLSALVNGAGMINAFLGYVLLAEPFLFLGVLVNTKPSEDLAKTVGKWLLVLGLVQIPIGLFQWPQAIALRDADYVAGSFKGLAQGPHVLGAISMSTAFYIVWSFPHWRLWWKALLVFLLFFLVAASGSKQVIVAFGAGYVIYELRRIDTWKAGSRLAAKGGLFIGLAYLAFRIFDPRFYTYPVATAVRHFAWKFKVFPLVAERIDSLAGWIFGLGPGHTVGRMGGLLLDHYWHVLEPLGATRTNLHDQAMSFPWLPDDASSFFQPMFSWAGIFGDVGLAGILVYGGLLCFVYLRFCVDRLSRFLVIVIVALGFVFDWLEQYNFMLFVAAVIGQRWLMCSAVGASSGTLTRPVVTSDHVCQSPPDGA